jgi:hypothetical protein
MSTHPEPQQMTKEQIDLATTGVRFNSGKLQWGLIDYKALHPLIQVLEFGAKKYSANNWKKGLPPRQILESMQRHLANLLDGNDKDLESGLPEIGHILCNAMFYSYFEQRRCCGNWDSEGGCKCKK